MQIQKKVRRVTGPVVRGAGKPGPKFPTDENPHDFAGLKVGR